LMRNLLKSILSNLDTILAIVLAVVAAIFGIFGIFPNALMPAIAGALALLATSLIRDRTVRDRFMVEVQKLNRELETLKTRPTGDGFFSRKTSETALIAEAKEEVWLLQETGSKVVEENFKTFEALIKQGGKLYLITASTDPAIVALIALRNKNLSSEAIVSRQADAGLKIRSLKEATSGSPGEIAVRHLPYPLDITAVFVDPQAQNVEARRGLIRMVGFKSFFDDKRDFVVSYRDAPETFEYFSHQFRQMWDYLAQPTAGATERTPGDT